MKYRTSSTFSSYLLSISINRHDQLVRKGSVLHERMCEFPGVTVETKNTICYASNKNKINVTSTFPKKLIRHLCFKIWATNSALFQGKRMPWSPFPLILDCILHSPMMHDTCSLFRLSKHGKIPRRRPCPSASVKFIGPYL